MVIPNPPLFSIDFSLPALFRIFFSYSLFYFKFTFFSNIPQNKIQLIVLTENGYIFPNLLFCLFIKPGYISSFLYSQCGRMTTLQLEVCRGNNVCHFWTEVVRRMYNLSAYSFQNHAESRKLRQKDHRAHEPQNRRQVIS